MTNLLYDNVTFPYQSVVPVTIVRNSPVMVTVGLMFINLISNAANTYDHLFVYLESPINISANIQRCLLCSQQRNKLEIQL